MTKAIKSIMAAVLVVLAVFIVVAILYPFVYKDPVLAYSEEYDLDPMLVMAIIKTESSFNQDAISRRNARGLMQIGESTGRWAADVLEIDDYSEDLLYNPSVNVRIGTWYMRVLLDQYGDQKVALAAYNAGSGNVSSWLANSQYSSDGKTLHTIPFQETSDYVRKVEEYGKIYQYIYGNRIYSKNDTFFDFAILNLRKSLINLIKGIR